MAKGRHLEAERRKNARALLSETRAQEKPRLGFRALFAEAFQMLVRILLLVPGLLLTLFVFLWSVPFRIRDLWLEARHPFLAGDAVGRFLIEGDRSVVFWDLYCAFRHGKLSRRDSFFNAFYIRLSEKAQRHGKLQKAVQSVPKHPNGWYKREEQAHRRTFAHFLLSAVSVLPAVLSYGPSRIHRFFKNAIHSLESSHTAVAETSRFMRAHAGALVPLAIAGVVCTVMLSMANIPLTYTVRVDGQPIGYIESREELESALHEVESGVSDALGCSFKFPETISFSLEKTLSPNYLSKMQLVRALSDYTRDYVRLGYALYVDGKLTAAADSEYKLRVLLNTALQTAKETMGTEDLSILNNTRIVYQNCPADAFLNDAELSELLVPLVKENSTAITLNSYSSDTTAVRALSQKDAYSYSLTYDGQVTEEVSTVSLVFGGSRIEEVTESVPFNITYRESDTVYLGAQYVYQRGVEGEKLIAYQVFYSGDTEYARNVVSETITEEAIDQIILIGTKPLPQNGEPFENGTVSTEQHCFIPPVYGPISSYFGLRDMDGDGVLDSGHSGVDIPAAYGSPVYAGMSGIVIEEGDTGTSYGIAVKILHPNGLFTYYAHLAKTSVRVGQAVSQNQMIGTVGTTGVVTGPHVHFEVMDANKTRFNPLYYLIGY